MNKFELFIWKKFHKRKILKFYESVIIIKVKNSFKEISRKKISWKFIVADLVQNWTLILNINQIIQYQN
jgi:hypothetical protein